MMALAIVARSSNSCPARMGLGIREYSTHSYEVTAPPMVAWSSNQMEVSSAPHPREVQLAWGVHFNLRTTQDTGGLRSDYTTFSAETAEKHPLPASSLTNW